MRQALALTILVAMSVRADEPRTLADWSARSPAHARVVAVLEDHDRRWWALFGNATAQEPEEKATLDQLAECEVAPLRDMAISLEADASRRHRILLVRALTSSKKEGARLALKEVLAPVPEPRVYAAVLEVLPKTPESTELIFELLDGATKDFLVRSLLVEELGARNAFAGERRARLVRILDEEPDHEVLGTAVGVVRRMGDRSFMEQLRALWTRVPELQLRHRIIGTYADLGQDEALEFLDTIMKDAEGALRETWVLAIGRMGSPAALQRLERIAKEDASREIRARAAELVDAMRAGAKGR